MTLYYHVYWNTLYITTNFYSLTGLLLYFLIALSFEKKRHVQIYNSILQTLIWSIMWKISPISSLKILKFHTTKPQNKKDILFVVLNLTKLLNVFVWIGHVFLYYFTNEGLLEITCTRIIYKYGFEKVV